MTVLGESQQKPEVLDWARTRRADTASISKADIDLLARRYLSAGSASRAIIRPYAAVGTGPMRSAPAPQATPPPDGM
jgi:zinc protease